MAVMLYFLPGVAATFFVFLAIANGGEIFGLAVDWLLNCSLLAVPSLTLVIGIVVMMFLQRHR